MYDDFVAFAGGFRISNKFEVPEGKKNADYFFDLQQLEIVLELKQISKYFNSNTVDQYFSKLLFKGKIKRFNKLSTNQIEITPDSLSKADWNDFYKRFRPAVSNSLKDAALQLRDTEDILPAARKPRFKGVIFINTGDYNLPTDLLFRLIEWKVKLEWKMARFSSIDFVSCSTIDMYKEGQNPLYARHIARSIQDKNLVAAVHYLYDRWIYYNASALGFNVSHNEKAQAQNKPLNLQQPFAGKITWHPPASDSNDSDHNG